MQLIPWRKGPFRLNDIHIQTEWNSYLKWERFQKHINLKDKTVLDIGCGSGYHLFLMKHAGAKQVLGIDPMELFWFQFLTLNHFCKEKNIHFLPIKWQECKQFETVFDVIFCMGVLYHQKDPQELLTEINSKLTINGTLILETLIIDTNDDSVLCPPKRYANMRNVYYLPSVKRTIKWLKKSGYSNIKCLDISKTTENEQQKSSWSPNYSFLESVNENKTKTVEGHPPPIRAIFIATK